MVLAEIFRHFCEWTPGELEAGLPRFQTARYTKATVLLRKGEPCGAFYVVLSGALRTYFLSDGTERTRLILTRAHMGTSLASFLTQTPSQEFIDVLEDAEVCRIERSAFYELVERYPSWRSFYIRMLEAAYLFQNRKIEERETLDAGERLSRLREHHPEIVGSLSNSVVASYLGITPETLSRLKSRF